MELKEFINNILTQIAADVQNAIEQSSGKDYLISPATGKIGVSCTVGTHSRTGGDY